MKSFCYIIAQPLKNDEEKNIKISFYEKQEVYNTKEIKNGICIIEEGKIFSFINADINENAEKLNIEFK